MQVILTDDSVFSEEKKTKNYVSINIDGSDVRAAKKVVLKFIDKIKATSVEKKVPSLFFVTLIVMNLITQDMIKAYEPEKIKEVMDFLKKKRGKRAN